ncbi:hypothetical protein QIA36_06900 (plasmid) [Borreliella yangtzensis]|uniref:hypothetical protein n=1 Tax=Borreliella yangtzensis TaxID=683292 RepID=UPI003B217E49
MTNKEEVKKDFIETTADKVTNGSLQGDKAATKKEGDSGDALRGIVNDVQED